MNDLKSCGVRIHGGWTTNTTEHSPYGSTGSQSFSGSGGGGVLRHTSVFQSAASSLSPSTYVTSQHRVLGKAMCSARVMVCSGSATTQGATSRMLAGCCRHICGMLKPGAATVNAKPVAWSMLGRPRGLEGSVLTTA